MSIFWQTLPYLFLQLHNAESFMATRSNYHHLSSASPFPFCTTDGDDRIRSSSSRCIYHCCYDHRSSCTSGTALAVESSQSYSEWHHAHKDSSLKSTGGVNASDGNGDVAVDSINLSGCDAIITTLDMNNHSIDPYVWARTLQQHDSEDDVRTNRKMPPKEAMDAIEATHRWSADFVRRLSLCPWAGSSLDTPGAIRYWVLLLEEGNKSDGVVLDRMEDLVREAGKQLEEITTRKCLSSKKGMDSMAIDPSVAISFVILVDKTSTNSVTNIPDFPTFHEFFLDLEDRLLDECDEYWEENEDDTNSKDEEDANEHNKGSDSDEDIPLGCEITIAAFHPQWQFGSNTEGKEEGEEQAIDFEKRTPYPTISIVMTSAIDALISSNDEGNEDGSSASSASVTERIAVHNEKILEDMGVERLKELFDTDVMHCPMKKEI